MKEYLDGWKVVFERNDIKTSFVMRISKAAVTYEFGKTTKPQDKCGPLSVFMNYDDAYAFYSLMNTQKLEGKIYPCIYVRSEVEAIWTFDQKEYLNSLPRGTALADEVIIFHNDTERIIKKLEISNGLSK